MKRRHLLGAGLAIASSTALSAPAAKALAVRPGAPGSAGLAQRRRLGRLGQATHGRLAVGGRPSLDGLDARKLLSNPFYMATNRA